MSARYFPLTNHLVMHTTDPSLAEDRLKSSYGVTKFDVLAKKQSFETRVSHLQIGDVGLYCCDYTDEVLLGFGEVPFLRQIFNINGSATYSGGAEGHIAEGAYSGVLQSNVPLKFNLGSNYRHFVLRIEQPALQRHLNALLGRDIAGQLAFHDAQTDHAAMRRLQRMVFQFASDFDVQGDVWSPLAAAEMTRGLMMNFLLCHKHDHSDALFRRPAQSDRSMTRKVEEYIESNWDKPLDIEQLSAVAQVSMRTLFRQFKKDRGHSPAEFVRRVRLDRARNLLETGVQGTSVTQVALRCGFQNTGHFAREFRLAFGELPSETLRRALRAS